jgi:uncharacterized protein (DUF983 family)
MKRIIKFAKDYPIMFVVIAGLIVAFGFQLVTAIAFAISIMMPIIIIMIIVTVCITTYHKLKNK